jgi:putative endonuclease
MSRGARVWALRRGTRAEALCAWWLRLHGYRIVARNLRTPVGEIDILARRGSTLAAVEVKARADLAEAGESVTHRQRRRIRRALGYYLAAHPAAAALDVRFDAMLVTPWHLPHHVIDAWRDEPE